MESVIKELFGYVLSTKFGEIAPDCQEKYNRENSAEAEFKKTFSEEQRKLFNTFMDMHNVRQDHEIEELFCIAFKEGFKLAMEIFQIRLDPIL